MATEEKTAQPFGNLINPYTNKPVQTGKGVSFNQKIYDAPNYMQQKNDLLDSFNSGMTRQKSVNEQALYDIPVVPEFMNEEYNQAYQAANWLNSLNIATPDEIDEWRAKGKMGIGETAQRLKSLKSAKYVPFVGTTAEVGYNLDMLSAMNRLKKGEKVSQVEQDLLVDYLRELKEIQVRGTTLPSKTLNAILESIPFFIEFGTGVAAAPETFGGSLSVSALALSKAAGKKAARKAVSKALSKAATESVMTGSKKGLTLSAAKQLYKSTYDDMLKAGAGKAAKEVGAKEAAKIVAKTTPESIIAANFGSKPLTYMTAKNTIGGFADRQLAGGMQVTDAGELVFLEPENMALSIMKSFGSSIFDNYTETMGWAFAPVTSYFAKPVRNVLPKKFFTEFDKLVSSRYGMPAAQALKKYGYDGVVEEMGEELLNRFLCDVFGIEGLEGYTIDGFMNNVFYANDPEQWLVEAMSFAAMGGAAHGTHGAYTKIREELEKQGNQKAVERLTELANKRIYSPAEFYLEQGLIKIDGSQSAAEQELRKKFEERGVDKNTANQFFSNASELEIREQLRQYYEEDSQDADKRREKAVDFLANRMLENNSYKNKDLAEKNANLFVTALEKFSETNGVAIEDLIRDEAPTIRNQSEIEGAIREAAPEASTQYAEKFIEDIYNEISALPDDYQDTEYIETQLKNADLAERIKYNTLTDEDYAAANEFINELEAADYIDLANELRAASGYEFEDNNQYMQRTEFTDDEAQIRRKEGYNQLFQSADVAGSERGEAADAAKEWQEKGTDSKYFKKWFGNSKVVDENGKPLVVYHGSRNNFEVFEHIDGLDSDINAINTKEAFFFVDDDIAADKFAEIQREAQIIRLQAEKHVGSGYNNLAEKQRLDEEIKKQSYNDNIRYNVYLSIQNPIIVNFEGREYSTEEVDDLILDALENGNDGVIIKNIDDVGGVHTQYAVFNPEQIKSVDNRGTFDAENPNIYYQSAYHGSPYKFDEFSTDFMGKGEGAQAHGWGLYFAKDKKISEKYRLESIGYENVANTKYKGKKLNSDYEQTAYWRLKRNGLPDALRYLDARVNFYQKQYDDAVRLYPDATQYIQDRKDILDAYKNLHKSIQKAKLNDIEIDEGQLYKVDVPEKKYLLDEQKTFSQQTKTVQKAIQNIPAKFFDMKEYNMEEMTGEDIYGEIVNNIAMRNNDGNTSQRELEEAASKLLNKYGIKGITYDGKQDGRCYVVFDDKAVKVLEKYYQGEDDAIQGNMLFDNAKARELRKVKGSYVPAENLIELFKNADESTVVHEFAHWWLDRLVKYSANNEELAADVEAIRKFVKNDGEEFTREQHEKFARGFEAYIRSGYAKNNRLKRIFEDFKNALLAIYDSIKQLGYKDDDMPQIQNLFDRLLTSEKERIRATVFDKIAEIDAKIENIKENEAKEFADLDSIYKDNIAYLDRQSQKKRSVQEYLEMAETIPFRETKETREFKKRYKDATFEILEVATGYKRQFIANPRNWEKVQAAFEATDRITATDGMHPNWREFYPDTGVSYDNDEVDGDNKLAQMAFDVMTEGSYNKTYADNFEFEEIDKFYTKFDYLNNKVKTLKGTEKRAAYEAMISLFNDLPAMPDEMMVEIFNKMNSAEDEYEHQQREDFNRMIIPSIPVMQQLQFYITRKLDALKIYNPEIRYKMKLNRSHRLYRYIKDINSVNAAKKQIRRINEFVIDDMRNNQRMLLHKEIQKQIKVNSKVVKVGTLTKGKFDWKTNTVFAELVEMNKMKREDAEKELGNIVQIQDAEKGENRDSYDENETAEFNKPNDFQDNLRKKFLQYRSMRLQDLDVTHTIQLLQDILELKEKGRQAKSEEDFINKTQRWNTRNNLLDVLEVTKQSGAAFGAKWVAGVGKGVSLNGGTLANWESLLNALFNKDTAQKYSLLQDEAKSEIYARKHMLDFYKKAADIYGFNQGNAWDRFLDYDYMQPLIKLMQEYGDEKYTYTQQVFSINSPDGYARSQIEISRAQMITMFAWSLNEQLEQRLFTQFGLQQIREMFEERLSEQDKQLAWALVDTCENMREDINDVFIRTTGLSLPAVSNYFPSKAERVQSDIDMYHDNFVKSSNPSFIKQRKTCNRIPMKPLAPLEILIPHINKTAKYVIMSEHVNFLNQIFKDTAIKTKMQEIWGSKDGADIYQTLINKLAACTFTNYSKGTNLVAGALDTLSRNYITSAIGFSPKVAIGQLLSVINYAENMPSSEWVKGFAETLKHPVENFKYMMENCEYLQTRLAGNSQNEVISILTSEKDKFRTLRNFMTSNVKWGDIIAITLGGKAYVDWLMKQGMTKEAAFDKFVEDTLRAQQAGTTSSISEWQSAQARNCLTRMFFAFRNTDMQYERKFVDTLIQMKRGDIPKKEAIKKLLIYKIFNPFMFTSFLQNLSVVALIRGAFAGDDPDDVIGGFLKSAVEAVMLGGMTAYGFAGFIASSFMQSLVALYDKEYKHFETDVPIMGDFDRQIQKYLKGDLTVGDYVDALAMGTELTLGLPASKVVNSAEGIGDIAQGNIGTGLSRLAGWGKYTSTKAWTGKEPEKKKKKKRKK